MTGTRGPVPLRSEERVRKNAPEIPIESLDVAQLIQAEVERPAPDPDWHPTAKMMYESLAESAQCVYYEASDWSVAYLMCESISRDLSEQVVGITETGEVVKDYIPLKGASLSAYLKGFTALLMTEGDRRRSQLEIKRAAQIQALDADDASVTNIADHRAAAVGND